jgi:calpain-7
MKALNITDNPNHKKYLDSKCKDLVRRAETIKASKEPNGDEKSPSPPKRDIRNRPRKLKEPISNRELPKSEQIILWKGSNLNGFKFPPWESAPAPSEFEESEHDGPFL